MRRYLRFPNERGGATLPPACRASQALHFGHQLPGTLVAVANQCSASGPAVPSTRSRWPVLITELADPVAVTAGSPYSRHTMAACDIIPPMSETAAAIFGAYGPPDQIRRIDFDGHLAWFSSVRATAPGASETNHHLTWEAGGNAYDIVARTATEEQLVAFARTLAPAAIGDVKDVNGAGGSVATTATLASGPTPTGACGPRSLVINS